jgi:5-methyltetrahydrofolate--homocysteine methyltransferase
MENILDRLQRGEVIVGDGALGTMLMQRGLQQGEPPESFNTLKPGVLEEIASLYLEAGSEIVSTNTFGASPLRLQQFSMEKDTEILNRNAVEAVRRAVGDHAYVSGSIGPSAKMIKRPGDSVADEILASFKQQSRALLEAGVDLICIETMTDTAEAVLAIQAVRSLNPKIPIMATLTFGKIPRGYFTIMGNSVQDSVAMLQAAGADIVGSNCGNGTDAMIEIAREFRKYTSGPIAIQSNAGLPVSCDGNLIYPETPEYFSKKAQEMIDLGVQIIGGCCGTTPEHIRAVRKIVNARR